MAGGCFYEYWEHIQEFSGINLNGLEEGEGDDIENKNGPVIRVGTDYGALAVCKFDNLIIFADSLLLFTALLLLLLLLLFSCPLLLVSISQKLFV